MAGRTLNQYKEQDLEALKGLKGSAGLTGLFGISRVQRSLRIGYNRAAHLVDLGIDLGILVRDVKEQHLVKFAEKNSL
ncbi:hypothetical protein AUR67_00350 [Pseudoalteromonas sp. XI10]|uniref:DNA translocase FtsK n=1 Tax=Pseudoalteromonas sp. XI10 TaxID=1766621 RepID=UPI0007337173|nr:DNA translocase FtsK [Pseudoalteromonas sp. XI10]KTG21963.1 hypothetical protein AUR67_00350 [Pseudoalteromonas sp. XI10]